MTHFTLFRFIAVYFLPSTPWLHVPPLYSLRLKWTLRSYFIHIYCKQLYTHWTSDLEKTIFLWTPKFWEYRFSRKLAVISTNLKLWKNSINQIFNQCALVFSFFFFTGATWYYHSIYIGSIYRFCFIYRLWRWYFWSFF